MPAQKNEREEKIIHCAVIIVRISTMTPCLSLSLFPVSLVVFLIIQLSESIHRGFSSVEYLVLLESRIQWFYI